VRWTTHQRSREHIARRRRVVGEHAVIISTIDRAGGIIGRERMIFINVVIIRHGKRRSRATASLESTPSPPSSTAETT